jgi:hypothetical protein
LLATLYGYSHSMNSHSLTPACNRPLNALRLTAAVCLLLAGLALMASSANAATPPPPAVSTSGITGLSYSAVTLHGRVDPRGQATNYFFQYGHTRGYGAQTPLAPAGSENASLAVSQAVTGLAPLTVYHYRIVAVSAGGVALGSDQSFTTPKIPLSVAIVGVPNPVLFGSPFTVEGTLSGTGSANHEVRLEANGFPYLGGFQPLGNAELTSATGGFSFPVLGLLQNTQLRVATVGKPFVASPVIVEGVAVRVTMHVHATHRRGFARLYGTVAPAEVGALVGFQLLKPGHRSVNVGGTIVKVGTATVSSFSRVIRVHRGLYKALVRVNDGAHLSAYSSPLAIR